jgi:hypothetical protein
MTLQKEQPWMARRALRRSSGGEVEVRIGAPEKVPGGEWRCAFQVAISPDSAVQYAYGLDQLQALLMALVGVRAVLDTSGLELSWEGGEPGDHGMPFFVPQYFGLAFSRRLEALVVAEVEGHSRRAADSQA